MEDPVLGSWNCSSGHVGVWHFDCPGGWFWNAHIDVEGVETHVVWTVEDDPTGADDYKAKIKMVVPREADAHVVAKAPNERVRIRHSGRLDCLHNGIEAFVKVKVKPMRGAEGEDVRVTVYEGPPGPSGTVLGEDT